MAGKWLFNLIFIDPAFEFIVYLFILFRFNGVWMVVETRSDKLTVTKNMWEFFTFSLRKKIARNQSLFSTLKEELREMCDII